jgi:hypothetical protein
MPKTKKPEPRIKVHKRFKPDEWTHESYDGTTKNREVRRYTVKGQAGYWRLVRQEMVSNGERSVGYFLDRVPVKGEYQEIGECFGSRPPAWERVTARILVSLLDVAMKAKR